MNRRKLFSDTFFYALIQASNFAIPLISLPYITRVIGVEKFGVIELALVFVNFFVLLVKYGFDYTATRDVATHKEDKDKLNIIFTEYMIAKILILMAAVVLFLLCLINVQSIKGVETIYILTFLGVTADYLLPTWFFRGKGDIKVVAIINFFSKLLFLPLIFIFLTEEDDYFYRPLIMSLSSILFAAIGLMYAIKKYELKFNFVSFYSSLLLIYQSTPMYISTCLIFLSGAFNIVIIDNYTNASALDIGNFAAANKVIQIIQNVVILSISQVFYPFFVSSYVNNKDKFGQLIFVTFAIKVTFGLFIAFILYVFSDLIVTIVFGDQFSKASEYLSMMAFIPLLILLANLFMIQALAGMGRDVYVMLINICAFIMNITSVVWCYEQWLFQGVIYQRITLQIAVISFALLIFSWIYMRNKKFSLFKVTL